MTPLVAVPLLAAAVAAVANWAAVWMGGPRGAAVERVAKPATLVLLIVAAVNWPADAGSVAAGVRPWLLLGLAASLAGDVFLLPPGRFIPGLVAFLLGHLAYLVAFMALPAEGGWLAAGIVAGVALIGTVGRTLVRLAARIGLGAPVAAYLVAITLMALAATRTGEPAAIAGSWLFVASDAMLGWGRFSDPAPGTPRGGGRMLGTGVMVTYHLGQALILLALIA